MKIGDKFTLNGIEWSVVAIDPMRCRYQARTAQVTPTGVSYYQLAWWNQNELSSLDKAVAAMDKGSKKACKHDWRKYDSGFPASRTYEYCFDCGVEK